jgi:hypothetical protein
MIKAKEYVAAKNLKFGDILEDAKTGKQMKVTLVVTKSNRTIVLFDEDLEIDFDNYHQLQVYRNA